MTAYEKIGDQYYLQGSDEYYAALEQPVPELLDLGTFLGKLFKRHGLQPQDVNRILIQALPCKDHDVHCGDRQES